MVCHFARRESTFCRVGRAQKRWRKAASNLTTTEINPDMHFHLFKSGAIINGARIIKNIDLIAGVAACFVQLLVIRQFHACKLQG